jgi:hypothetical protein
MKLDITPAELANSTQSVQWSVVHDPTYYANDEGLSVYHNANVQSMNITFDKPGMYTLQLGAPGDYAVNPNVFYVHRKPEALFTTSLTGLNLTVASQSYDLDTPLQGTNGITDALWQYKETTASTWTTFDPAQTLALTAEKRYLVQLTVKDAQNTWSEPVAKVVSTVTGETMKPIASFEMNPVMMNKQGNTTLTVNDTSYDPTGLPLGTYTWTVKRGSTVVYTGATPMTDFSQEVAGEYQIILKVNNGTVDSDEFSRKLYLFDEPTLSTGAATNITQTSATLAGTVTADGGLPVLSRGIVYGTSADVTLANGTALESYKGTGTFTVNPTSIGGQYYYRTYVVRSTGVTYDSNVQNFVTLNPPMTVSNLSNATINEDGTHTASLTITTTNNTLTFTRTSSNTALVPTNNIFITGTGGNRTITVTPVANVSGSTTINITVTNGLNQTESRSFVLTVNSVNDAPSFTKGPDVTSVGEVDVVAQNWATGMTKGPADEASQTLQFIVTNDSQTLFTQQPAISTSGELTFKGRNVNGTATVTVKLKDNGGTTNNGTDESIQTFKIHVVDSRVSINEQPYNPTPSSTPTPDKEDENKNKKPKVIYNVKDKEKEDIAKKLGDEKAKVTINVTVEGERKEHGCRSCANSTFGSCNKWWNKQCSVR